MVEKLFCVCLFEMPSLYSTVYNQGGWDWSSFICIQGKGGEEVLIGALVFFSDRLLPV